MLTLKLFHQDRTACRASGKEKRERERKKLKQAFKGECAYYNKSHTAIQKKGLLIKT